MGEQFYETFGEDVTNEFVNWFNAVDAYRADLRELNELNFARFDAKLGERLAELKVEFSERLRTLETRLVRWMLGFWISTVLGLGALFFRA